MHHVIVIHYCDQFMIFRGRGLGMRLVGKRNAQEGTKQNAATQSQESRYRCHAFLGLNTLPLLTVPTRAGTVLARFQVAV